MSAPDNGENEITDFDRYVADQVAGMYPVDGMEPDYEWSANIRREVESVMMYVEVYGLSYSVAQALVTTKGNEAYARSNGWWTPAVEHAVQEVYRVVWSGGTNNELMDVVMAAFNAIHEEQMKK
jgi:hypothetical protein